MRSKRVLTIVAVAVLALAATTQTTAVTLNETTFDKVPPYTGSLPNPAEPMTDGRDSGYSGGTNFGPYDTVNGWTWYTEGSGTNTITIDPGTIGTGVSVMKETGLQNNNPMATKTNAGHPQADVCNLEWGPNGTVSAIIQTFNAVDLGGGTYGQITIDIDMGRRDRSGKGLAWVMGTTTNFANFDYVIPNGAAGALFTTSFTPTAPQFQIGFFSGVGADTNASVDSIKVSSAGAGPPPSGPWYWNTGTDDWNVAGNWLPTSVPDASEAAFIDNGGTANIDNYGAGPDAEADDVIIGSVPGASGTINVNAGAEFNTDDDLLVGQAAGSTGTVNFSGHEINVGDEMIVGNDGTGHFTQTAGELFVLDDDLRIGDGEGGPGAIGTFTLSGGSSLVEFGDDLHLGTFAGATGTFTMSDGEVIKVDNGDYAVYVGERGTGTFTQTGGLVELNGYDDDIDGDRVALTIGHDSTGVGLYQISGNNSDLIVEDGGIVVGNAGQGTFEHSDGAFVYSEREMHLGENPSGDGTYTISGAFSGLEVDDDLVVGREGTGVFNQNGGTVEIRRQLRIGTEGSGDGTYNLTDGELTMGRDLFVGREGTGEFNQSGGEIDVGRRIYVGEEDNATGEFNQTGGTVFVDGRDGDGLILGNAGDAEGTYSIAGTSSELTVREQMIVGLDGTGTFTQTGGTVTVVAGDDSDGDLILAAFDDDAVGTYTMSGGELTMHGDDLVVGGDGDGIFTQTGGTVDVDDDVKIGDDDDAEGDYFLSGPSSVLLKVRDRLSVGVNGEGTFTQTGGTVQVDDDLRLGDNGGSDGTYTISGGVLTVADKIHNTDSDNAVGLFRILGSGATIGSGRFEQKSASELNPRIGNGGISVIDVDDEADLDGDIRMGVWGGVALTAGDSFTVLSSDDRSGTLNNLKPAMWDITYPGDDVLATLINSLGTESAGYGTLTEISAPPLPLAGSNADWLTIDGIRTDLDLWVLLDLRDATGDLGAPGREDDLADLADFIAGAGQRVSTEFSGLPANYDLLLAFDPALTTYNFAWDFSDYDPQLLVTGLAVGMIPEPATFLIWALGLIGLAWYARRRRTK